MFPNVRVVGADEAATTAAAADALQVVAQKAKLFTVCAYNGTGGTLYLQAHDVAASTDLTADTSVPKLVTPVYATTSGGFNFGDGAIFTKGIYLCFSAAALVWTEAASTSELIDATFKRLP